MRGRGIRFETNCECGEGLRESDWDLGGWVVVGESEGVWLREWGEKFGRVELVWILGWLTVVTFVLGVFNYFYILK